MFNLAAIALVLTLIGLGVAYLLVAAAKRPATMIASRWSEPVMHKKLAGTQLLIPKSWMRASWGQQGGEFAEQVDLRLNLRFGPETKLFTVKLRLIALAKAQPSSFLLDAVYARQFSLRQVSGAPGLVGKPLNPTEGFQSETVWYDPISPNPFVAKCLSENAGGATATCLRTVQASRQLAVIYQFDADLLPYWKNFDAAMLPFLAQIGVISRN